jgi:hypothetical protein
MKWNEPDKCCWCNSDKVMAHYCGPCDITVSWSCVDCFRHIVLREGAEEQRESFCDWDHVSDAKENEEFYRRCKEEDERNKKLGRI